MTARDSFEEFDALLSVSNCDRWADGQGLEDAQELLGKFTSAQWSRLEHEWRTRDKKWRLCLESALCPLQSAAEGRLLLEMAYDVDPDVRYSALHTISFYCGVNSSGTYFF
ncbi:hypothetical protein DES53_1115 [Roseimicrobium gellanilyticum]|uniref:HEAT repeat protein n=1 Tax=Roseimicrobium gellanilyticum TaxID=748857 RepID=A0A366H8E2_9BACT|nr:hypothetical protein [Roseimicrobium gellanilyticum]RBP38488.1 hypothetical protein DES53_1115 [Roseimicrobium gellanilyticum]